MTITITQEQLKFIIRCLKAYHANNTDELVNEIEKQVKVTIEWLH